MSETALEDLRRAVRGLEVDARRTRRMLDRLPALVAFWDADCTNLFANQAYVEWFGQSPEDIRGRHIRTVLGEEVYAKNLPYIQGALAGEEQLFSRTLVDPSGRTRHSQASYVPEVVDGEVSGFSVLVTDVTPRVEAQRELDDAQELASAGSWVFYPRTGEMTWSRALFHLLGRDPDDDRASFEAYLSAVHPEDRPAVRARQAAAAGMTGAIEMRYRLLRPGGAVRHVTGRARPEMDEAGQVSRVRGTIQDETELQQSAAELARTNEELQHANQVLAGTIALLSHDIRQPVQSVTGFLELATEGWDTVAPPQLRMYVDRAMGSAERLGTLVDDVLVLLTLDSGPLATRPTAFRLAEVVEDVVKSQAPGVRLGVAVDGDPVALADPFHVRQVLANLVANAVRYGQRGLCVQVDAWHGCARLRVSDRGEGVPEEFVPHLFERFSRASTGVATTTAGSGFGLYIVDQLVRTNGGDITYAPREPHGACFTVTLPLAPPPGT